MPLTNWLLAKVAVVPAAKTGNSPSSLTKAKAAYSFKVASVVAFRYSKVKSARLSLLRHCATADIASRLRVKSVVRTPAPFGTNTEFAGGKFDELRFWLPKKPPDPTGLTRIHPAFRDLSR